MTADFSGYATRNNLRCSDGRTILADAFKAQDGAIVPLVYQHNHQEVDNILGHVKLENRADGVYCYAYFNDTPKGQHAKEMVRHEDIKWLSIFANNLRERVTDTANNFKEVVHGSIKEVSLVLAGANPGAVIDNVAIAHSDGSGMEVLDEAYITTGLAIELAHAATATAENEVAQADASSEDNSSEGEKTLADILGTLNPEQEAAVDFLLSQAMTVGGDMEHSDTDADESDEEAETEEVVDADESEDEADSEESSEDDEESEAEVDADNTEDEAGEEVQHDNITQEDNSMTTNNVFEAAQGNSSVATDKRVHLAHSEVETIIQDTLRKGSLHAAVQDYALAHGIENIEYLFPDAKTLQNEPSYISRRIEWVDKVLNSVRKVPFARIKTVHADITADEARARGYIKGDLKEEEFFTLVKRETTPQTVYKKQKLDRDDVVDIVDLDVVAFVKAEMQLMLSEELAGAILIGDGRSAGDDQKIKESNIRPIASDSVLYVTTVTVNLDDASSSVDELIDAAIASRRYYKGTGMPTFYTSEEIVGAFLTVKDGFDRRKYNTLEEIATVLRVKEVVPVEVFDRVPDLVGIMVNLADYSLGTDRGGQATMFDDFDLDYNKLIYLLETRVSGALTQPKAALVFRKSGASDVLATSQKPGYNASTKVVTIPTVTGVDYFVGDGNGGSTGSALTPGAQAALTEDTWYIAKPKSGYYFADNANDEWKFTV